jgi:hypothetical protein
MFNVGLFHLKNVTFVVALNNGTLETIVTGQNLVVVSFSFLKPTSSQRTIFRKSETPK